jgi:hypothetical protein
MWIAGAGFGFELTGELAERLEVISRSRGISVGVALRRVITDAWVLARYNSGEQGDIHWRRRDDV